MNLNLVLFAAMLLPNQTDLTPLEAKAQKLMQEMQAKYNAAKTLTVTTKTNVYVNKNGKKQLQRSTTQEVEAQRPSSFRMETSSNNFTQAIHREETISDGKFVWNYDDQSKQYTKVPSGGLLANLTSSLGTPGNFFLSLEQSDALLKPNPLVTMHYIGGEKIAGVVCEKVEVHFQSPEASLPSTVQTYYIGTDHILRRLVSQMKFKNQLSTTVIEVQATSLDKELPDSLFVFTPPPGATQKKLPDSP